MPHKLGRGVLNKLTSTCTANRSLCTTTTNEQSFFFLDRTEKMPIVLSRFNLWALSSFLSLYEFRLFNKQA